MAFSFKSFWSSLFPKDEPTQLVPVEQPVDETECFVRGLIKSMETEPEMWSEIITDVFTHKQTGLTLFFTYNRYRSDIWIPNMDFSKSQYDRLFAATKKHLYEPLRIIKDQAKLAMRSEERAALRPIIEEFAKKGCPSSSSDS
jgi:hypothetical protein